MEYRQATIAKTFRIGTRRFHEGDPLAEHDVPEPETFDHLIETELLDAESVETIKPEEVAEQEQTDTPADADAADAHSETTDGTDSGGAEPEPSGDQAPASNHA